MTARGWEDLSEILCLYEEESMKVDESLVGQYLHNERIVKEFTAYYDLFNKYKKEYQTQEILEGTMSEQTIVRARKAAFDERLSLLGMLIDKVISEAREDMEISDYLMELSRSLKAVRVALGKMSEAEEQKRLSLDQMLENQIAGRTKALEAARMAGSLSDVERRKGKRMIRFLESQKKQILLEGISDGEQGFIRIKESFESLAGELKERTTRTGNRIENLFRFAEEAFAEGNEMLILVTELTVNNDSARFIGQFGCPAYDRHSRDLMLSERRNSLFDEIAALDLEV